MACVATSASKRRNNMRIAALEFLEGISLLTNARIIQSRQEESRNPYFMKLARGRCRRVVAVKVQALRHKWNHDVLVKIHKTCFVLLESFTDKVILLWLYVIL